jgi:hypothetical protein
MTKEQAKEDYDLMTASLLELLKKNACTDGIIVFFNTTENRGGVITAGIDSNKPAPPECAILTEMIQTVLIALHDSHSDAFTDKDF